MSCKFCNGEAAMKAENEFWIEMNGSAMRMSHGTRYAEFASVVEINFCPMCGEALAEPEPLTLEELKGMDGEPVWVLPGKMSEGEWVIVDAQDNCLVSKDCGVYRLDRFGVPNRGAYRRPPKEGK